MSKCGLLCGAALLAGAGSIGFTAYTYSTAPAFEPSIDGNCYYRPGGGDPQCYTQPATFGWCISPYRAAPPCPTK